MDTGIKAIFRSGGGGGLRKTKGGRRKRERWEGETGRNWVGKGERGEGGDREKLGRKGRERWEGGDREKLGRKGRERWETGRSGLGKGEREGDREKRGRKGRERGGRQGKTG